jgi:hypothetical protein
LNIINRFIIGTKAFQPANPAFLKSRNRATCKTIAVRVAIVINIVVIIVIDIIISV